MNQLAGSKPTSEHLVRRSKNPDNVWTRLGPTNTPPNRNPVPRLCFSGVDGFSFDYEQYAETVNRSCLPGHAFFLDTCFITSEEIPTRFWESIYRLKVCIVPLIEYELQDWLNSPNCNSYIRDTFLAAKSSDDARLSFLDALDLKSLLGAGAMHYVTLLALRKQVYLMVRKSIVQKLGREPSKEELQSHVQKYVSDRGMTLAKKGILDSQKRNFMADESLLVRGFLYALETGNDVTILTRDRDLLEQFYKLQYLLDTHYRSHLMAKSYHEQPLNFQEYAMAGEGENAVFKSCKLLRMPAGMDHRVLPSDYRFVNVHVDYVGESKGTKTFSTYRFCADRQMLDVFRVKGKTNGLNTDLFANRNFHRCVDPGQQDELATFAGLAEDRFSSQGVHRWPAIDIEMVMTRCERGSAIEKLAYEQDRVSNEELELGVNLSEFAIQRLTATYSLETERLTSAATGIAISLQPPWTRFRATTQFARMLPGEIQTFIKDFNRDNDLETTLKRLSARTLPQEVEIRRIVDYYIALLSHRKLFGRVCQLELEKELSMTPTKEQVKSRVEQYAGAASWNRIEKYMKGSEDPRIFEEEEIVVDAMISAVYTGRDVIVLTDSQVLVEQFWALSQILESHYRSWCVSANNQERLNQLSTDSGDLNQLFRGNAYVANLEYTTVQSALPTSSIQIRLQVWLMNTDGTSIDIYPVGFAVEPAMRKMFECKIKNEMRSTDCLNGRNLHFQWSQSDEGQRFATCFLGQDDQVVIGSKSFPKDDRLELSINEVPAFDLVQITKQDRHFPFPWSKSAMFKS